MTFREALRQWFTRPEDEAEFERRLADLKARTPVPLFWLLGKTQTGKTSVVKYLTGAEGAEIGAGFKATTRFSRQYFFPTPELPLLCFLDTRGLEERDYDPAEDLARFSELAHVVIVTVRVMDQAQERVLGPLRTIRAARPGRPVLLVLTCLHEAYPQQQHVLPYPFGTPAEEVLVPEPLRLNIVEQKRRFAELVDRVVCVDLTRPEEGFNDPNYGGEALKRALLELLPHAHRQTLLCIEAATGALRDWHEQRAYPHILAYSTLAAAAGAIPVPFVDVLLLPGIQMRMVYQLAQLYGQPLTGERFWELAGALGLGLIARQAARSVAKFIPGLGSVLGAAIAGSSTFALGKTFCYYYSAVLSGHVPQAEDLRRYFHQQQAEVEKRWMEMEKPSAPR